MDINFEIDDHSDRHYRMLVESLPRQKGFTDDDLVELAKIAVRECNKSDQEDAMLVFSIQRPEAFTLFARNFLRGLKHSALQSFLNTFEDPKKGVGEKHLAIISLNMDEMPEGITTAILADYVRIKMPAITEVIEQGFQFLMVDEMTDEYPKGPVN